MASDNLVPPLTCTDVTARHSGFQLGPITHAFEPGVTCVVGANGAGKSTLFRLLADLRAPDSGTVSMSVNATHAGAPAIGYAPQELDFPRHARVKEWLGYVAWVYGIPRAERATAIDTALDSVGLADRISHTIGSLSGGMQRRLGISHALLHNPRVVLLDEPTAGLDPLQRAALHDIITGHPEAEVIIIATHLIDDVAAMADHVVVLREGSVGFAGSTDELARQSTVDGLGVTRLEQAITALMGGKASVR